mgnify:CR=1 FL=1
MNQNGATGLRQQGGDDRLGIAERLDQELPRLLHDIAHAQVKMAGLVEASRQEMRDLVARCERAAGEMRRAAEALERMMGSARLSIGRDGDASGDGGESASEEGDEGAGRPQAMGARSKRSRTRRARYRSVRSLRRGGHEEGSMAAGAMDGRKTEDRSGERGPLRDGAGVAGELERLVGEAEQLIKRLSQA